MPRLAYESIDSNMCMARDENFTNDHERTDRRAHILIIVQTQGSCFERVMVLQIRLVKD